MADVVVNNDNTNPKELLGQGIRAYILQDYNTAVTALSKASELLVSEHGDDLHDSLADVYLYYGKALLEFSREDSEALGDAVRNKEESDDDEEVENAEAEEGDGKEENEDTEANGASEGKLDDKTDTEEKEIEPNVVEKEVEPSGSGSADPLEEKTENEEEPTDLQVAWEVLELAKKIYQKRGEDGKKHLAETLVILGEVSLESENFESAVNDIKEGLRLQKELFPDDSRTVAETYYKLGIAYSTNTQIDEAIDSFQSSLQHLQNRINKLVKTEHKKDKIDEEIDEEISEIKGLIPDIEEKIGDMKSYKDETMKQVMSAVTESKPTSLGSSSSSSCTPSSSSKPASDISHLIKRKRKLDEIVEESEKEAEASPTKKPPS